MGVIKIKELSYAALFTALVTVSTMVFRIPVPSAGYVHLGDSIIFLVAIFFGKKYGFISAGLGSFLADILSGYAIYAPFTLVIKALMGFVVGCIATQDKKIFRLQNLLAVLFGGIIMVIGYLFADSIINRNFYVALTTSTLPNLLQVGAGAVIYMAIGCGFYRLKLWKIIK